MAAQFARIVDLVPYLPDELQMAAANLDDPSTLSYLVASSLRVPVAEKQELLRSVAAVFPGFALQPLDLAG